jgi:uncharacterized protein (TIGR04562 family)
MSDGSSSNYKFNKHELNCVVGGVSALDIRRLNVKTTEEARLFVSAYGYDLDSADDLEQLWTTHRRAVALIEEGLLESGESIPGEIADPAKLGDLKQLLIIASSRQPEDREMQRWACALLRVMHVYVHLRHDLFSAFRDEIQSQILKPLQEAIVVDDMEGCSILGPGLEGGGIRLHKFEIKPFKTTSSSVIKLLARPEKVALTLLDKLGVRIVTRSIFDSFRVVRFLIDAHLVSYPHIIPDQSNNTLYPLNLFIETMTELKIREKQNEKFSSADIESLLIERLSKAAERANFLDKENHFSGPEHRFIKFINRKLITVSLGPSETQRAFRFFYPYEIQIIDQDTYSKSLVGPTAHDEYKSRQRLKARRRVFGGSET